MGKLTCLALGALGALCLAVAGARAAAPTLVGSLDDRVSATSHTVTASGGCAAGNVLVTFFQSGVQSTSISDSRGGTWTASANVAEGGFAHFRHFYRVLAADFVGGVDTVTVSSGTKSGIAQIAVVCLDGATVEQSGGPPSPTTNSTTPTVTTGPITTAPQYIVAAIGAWNAGINMTDTNAPAWTQLALVGTAGQNGGLLVSYKQVTVAGGGETFSVSTITSTGWGGGYVGAPETGGGGPVVVPQNTLLTLGVGG